MSTHSGPHFWHFSASEVTSFFRTAPRIVSNQYLDALALPAAHAYGRLLVVTPRRLAPAPKRNQIRRRVKELFRIKHDPLSLTFDLLIIIKPDGLSLSFQELGIHLEHIIQKATFKIQNKALKPRKPIQKKAKGVSK